MSDDTVKIVQVANSNGSSGVKLISGSSKNRPGNIEPGSSDWQRWAIETLHELVANGNFKGKDVIAAIPSGEVFIDHMKMPRTKGGKVEDAVISAIKPKLPYDPDGAMIKYTQTVDDNIMVTAVERKKIDVHLAIYEKADLRLKSIAIWPSALTNSYVKFFGRRKTDIDSIVMLLDIETNWTNFVICRHKNLLFAHSIPIGARQIEDEEAASKLVFEIAGFRHHFSSMYKQAKIERLIFLSGQTVDKEICTTMAKKLEIPAQIGDCLAAVEIDDPYNAGIDRRGCQFSWATAFGLSLS
jgi:Tfp pilus assembly PilM family ATPase